MAEIHKFDAISALIEHNPADELIVASLYRPHVNARATYTIDVSPDLSLQLDSELPIRPTGINLRDADPEASEEVITSLLGETFAKAIIRAPHIGACAVEFTLDRDNAIAIALLQIGSPSTPPRVRDGCRTKVIAIKRNHPMLPDAA